METRHIRFLREVADSGSISAAARNLGLTQSALTKILARIEDELGTRLFDRTGRGVEPNSYGEIFLNRARRIGIEVEDLISEIRSTTSGITGTVVLGSGEVWVRDILPAAIAKSNARYPKLVIRVKTSPFDELMAGLWRGELDFILAQVRPGSIDDQISVEPIRDTVLMLTARKGHPLCQSTKPINPKELSQYQWALPSIGDPGRDHLTRVLARKGARRPVVAADTSSLQLLIRLLLQSDMLSLLPDVRHTVYAGQLAVLNAHWCTHRQPAGIVTLRGRESTTAVNNFLDILRREARITTGLENGQ